MSLNKQKTVQKIGQRTRLNSSDVQAILEALVEVWTEELMSGGRVELENFFVIEAKVLEGDNKNWFPNRRNKPYYRAVHIRRIVVRWSRNFGKQAK